MDQRAHEEAAAITATQHPLLKYVSWQESPEWMVPKAWWLRKHEPQVFAQADLIIEETDWLMHKLTGRWTASLCNVTCKWNYARPEGGWPVGLLEAIGFPELREKWPDEVLPMGAVAGELAREAAEALGLRPGIPVAEGGIDAYAAMLGVGVVKPGRMALVMGTSTCHMALCDRGIFQSHVWGPYPDAVLEGTWVLEGGQTATGAIVDWLADNFGYREEVEAQRTGRSRFEMLDEKAAQVPPGAEGLVVLDYWQGNRTPIRDPLARGVIMGLSLSHGIGHILRAVYESTAMGTRHILEDLAAAGYQAEGIYACGGGTRSQLWLQIHADVCQVPIYTTAIPEATALGTAMCAAVGAGMFPDLPSAAERMVKISREVQPNAENREVYDFYFDKYLRMYPALRDIMHETAKRG
jgi:FGGY-family pentulose kinase